MKTTKVLICVAALPLLVSLAACSTQPATTTTTTATTTAAAFNPDTDPGGQNYADVRTALGPVPKVTGDIKLGGVGKTFENEYWRTLKLGMETGAKKMTELGGMKVTIDVEAAQGENDEQGQLAIANNMINQKYTALLLSPISDANLVPAVETANAKGLPVVNVNDGIIAEAPHYVGPRAVQNGELAAEWISKKLNGTGEVAIVIGMPKAFAARQRTSGFKDWMAAHSPGIKVVEEQNADWDRSKAKDLADTWIKTHPNLKAIFCNNDDMALGVVESVKASRKDILVVGVDGIGEAYDSIRAGGLSATVDSFPLYKGQIAVEMTIRMLGGQQIPRVVWSPQALIDSTNVNTPAEQIINWQDPTFK